MDNFDLKKYLVENKVTTNSKMLNEEQKTKSSIDVFFSTVDKFIDLPPNEYERFIDAYEQAKAMHKKEFIYAYLEGAYDGKDSTPAAEESYRITFGE